MIKSLFIKLILTVTLSLPLTSSFVFSAEKTPRTESGTDKEIPVTKQWLALQRSGEIASKKQSKLSMSEAQAIKVRAEASFSHPIPDKFIKDKLGTD